MKRPAFALLILTSWCATASSADSTSKKATVIVRGAHCEACVQSIRKELSAVKGVKFVGEDLHAGKSPRFFSEPFGIEVGASLENGIGAAGKAVAKSQSPHRREVPPRLHLVLFTDFEIDEASVSKLRGTLQPVNGVLAEEAGGLGGFPRKRIYWIRLEPAGGADLDEIVKAAREAVDVRLVEEDPDP